MANDVHWVTDRITQARKQNKFVTEAVSVKMEKLLSGDFSERLLSSAKLLSIAKVLIEDMVPTPSGAETME